MRPRPDVPRHHGASAAPPDDDDCTPADVDAAPQTLAHGQTTEGSMRLDKWLWAARFYKTRSLAAEEIARGRVMVNDQAAKAARELRCGDRVSLRQGGMPAARVVRVRALSSVRGPAPVAQQLYEETADSLAARERWLEQRRLHTEPALAIEQGRPTKAARRQLAEWQRWSVSIDDEDGPDGSAAA